jgi:hypothetical protein
MFDAFHYCSRPVIKDQTKNALIFLYRQLCRNLDFPKNARSPRTLCQVSIPPLSNICPAQCAGSNTTTTLNGERKLIPV